MKKVFSIEKYVESVYGGDYEKAMKSFSVNKYERGWVFECVNKTIEDNQKNGYKISLNWCDLYAETSLEQEIVRFINKYGFTDYRTCCGINKKGSVFSVIFVDDGEISGEESYLIISPSLFSVNGFEINKNSIILYDIKKIQKLLD